MSKQDISFGQISPRHQVALELSDTLLCLGLDEVYGINMERGTDSKGKQYWGITFCKARTVDGVIRVYSDRFIQIKIQQRRSSEIFRSAYDAKRYLMREFL